MTGKAWKSLRAIDFALLGASLLLFVYFYRGFFFPGIYVMSYGVMARRIVWGIRILLPILYVLAVFLYINIRAHAVPVGSVVLMSIATLVGFVLAYDVADALYQNWFDSHKRLYHPYLQLMPAPYVPAGGAGQKITVFCLGGSTTELPDRAGRDWPSRVDSILRRRYGRTDVEVSNLGMEWYTSLHSLINYETNLRGYKPSVILIMQSVNDLLQNADFSYFSHGPFREDYGHFYGPVNRIIDRRSLWRYCEEVFKDAWYGRERRPVTTDSFPGLSAYERNIRTIVELAKHDGTHVVLMSEPSLVKDSMSAEEESVVAMLKVEAINDSLVWTTRTVANGMRQYNDRLQAIASDEHVPFIDLAGVIPKTLTYFRDEVHYRDTTFSVIAPYVAGKLDSILTEAGMRRK
ncbi:MAG TPA: SGNH/GDSL hydrolase family protein [Bacteroidota bacterium]|nr:SGNH/GDSL hydrolase family protein [Bacteroidota bacterium]